MDNAEFRQTLRAMGWTQAEAATALGLHLRTVTFYCATRRIPQPVAKLARILAELHTYDDLEPALRKVSGL